MVLIKMFFFSIFVIIKSRVLTQSALRGYSLVIIKISTVYNTSFTTGQTYVWYFQSMFHIIKIIECLCVTMFIQSRFYKTTCLYFKDTFNASPLFYFIIVCTQFGLEKVKVNKWILFSMHKTYYVHIIFNYWFVHSKWHVKIS